MSYKPYCQRCGTAIIAKMKIYMLGKKHLCPACSKLLHKATIEHLAIKAQENGWPRLTGSIKQINWALELRQKCLKSFSQYLKVSITDRPDEYGTAVKAYEIATSQKEAHFWIKERNTTIPDLIEELTRPTHELLGFDVDEYRDEAILEATIKSESPSEDTAAEISLYGNILTVHFCGIFDIGDLLGRHKFKRFGFEWRRPLNYRDGDFRDRLVEVSCMLLDHNFNVCVFGEVLRKKIRNSEWKPSPQRWLSANRRSTFFFLEWEGGENAPIFKAANSIKKSEWNAPMLKVPCSEVEEVMSFVEKHNFHVSAGAAIACQRSIKAKHNNNQLELPLSG